MKVVIHNHLGTRDARYDMFKVQTIIEQFEDGKIGWDEAARKMRVLGTPESMIEGFIGGRKQLRLFEAGKNTKTIPRDASWNEFWYVKVQATEKQSLRLDSVITRVGGRKSGYTLRPGGINEYIYEFRNNKSAVPSFKRSVKTVGAKVLAESEYM